MAVCLISFCSPNLNLDFWSQSFSNEQEVVLYILDGDGRDILYPVGAGGEGDTMRGQPCGLEAWRGGWRGCGGGGVGGVGGGGGVGEQVLLPPAPSGLSACLSVCVSGPRRRGSPTSRLPAAGRLSPPLPGALLRSALLCSAPSRWPR